LVIDLEKEYDMKKIEDKYLTEVKGGGWFSVWMNSRTAKKTCGEGNVKSVTSDGFTCKG
jgi:hypothetical protein